MQKAAATIRGYVAHIAEARKKVSGKADKARRAANSASMTFGSMHVYWKTAKKRIEDHVKRAGNAVDIDGMKRTLGEFDSGLGKELDAFA
jgi:hypothetical protein